MKLTYPENKGLYHFVLERARTAGRRIFSILKGRWQWPAVAAVVGLVVLCWQIYIWKAGRGRLEVAADGALFAVEHETMYEWIQLSVSNPGRVKISIRKAFLRCGESHEFRALLYESGDWPEVEVRGHPETGIRIPRPWPSAIPITRDVAHIDIDGGTTKSVYLGRVYLFVMVGGDTIPNNVPCFAQLLDSNSQASVVDLTAYWLTPESN